MRLLIIYKLQVIFSVFFNVVVLGKKWGVFFAIERKNKQQILSLLACVVSSIDKDIQIILCSFDGITFCDLS